MIAVSRLALFAPLALSTVLACKSSPPPANPPGEPPPPAATPAPSPDAVPPPTPAPIPPDPTAGADEDMKAVLHKLAALGGEPIETLSAEEARKQPTPADAVKALLVEQAKPNAPEPVGKVEDKTITVAGSKIPVRIYYPKEGKAPFPIVLYFHGGGFVLATNDTYDASARGIVAGTGAIVISPEYRKAPEHKFPAAHDDALAAYKWVVANAGALKGDKQRIALAGESAGGNLAAATAIAVRDDGKLPQPKHLLLVYPVASARTDTPSYRTHEHAVPLNKAMMTWFTEKYFNAPMDGQDPRINLLGARLTDLPPTTIINAELDPLTSDGEELATALEAAKVDVDQKTYEGMAHEFFGMGAAVADAQDAMDMATGALKAALEKGAEKKKVAQSEE